MATALIVLAWHPNVWIRFSQGYPGDSFLTLTIPGRAGLVVLTGLMMVLLLNLSLRKTGWLQRMCGSVPGGKLALPAIDLLLILVVFATALTVVPQIYYSYYLLLFDGLPRQWVIKPISIQNVWHSLSIPRDGNMALHATGLYGWWLIFLVMLSWCRAVCAACSVWWLIGAAVTGNFFWHWFV